MTVSPTIDPDLFWATAGGLGLTGVILEATFRCLPIETSRLLVDTDRVADLDAVMALMEAGDADYDFSVAWVDLSSRGAAMGRSVLTRGRFATAAEVPGDDDARRAYDPSILLAAPPVAPSGLLNPVTIRAFNEVWFRKAPKQRRGELQAIPTFWHPLDMVEGWNRVYGRRGFLQWQYAVPVGAEATVRRTVQRLSDRGCASFVNVLKRFGPGNPGPLSFPMRRLDTLGGHPRRRARARPAARRARRRGGRGRRPRSTWPRTAACVPSCCRSCTPASTSGRRSGPGSTPTASSAAISPAG